MDWTWFGHAFFWTGGVQGIFSHPGHFRVFCKHPVSRWEKLKKNVTSVKASWNILTKLDLHMWKTLSAFGRDRAHYVWCDFNSSLMHTEGLSLVSHQKSTRLWFLKIKMLNKIQFLLWISEKSSWNKQFKLINLAVCHYFMIKKNYIHEKNRSWCILVP